MDARTEIAELKQKIARLQAEIRAQTDQKHEKRRDALGLFYESVLKPDHQLRQCAHNSTSDCRYCSL